jgi:hypothetical protein
MKRFFRKAASRLKANALIRGAVFRLRAMSLDRHTAALGRAGQMMEAGNFNAAADYLASIEGKQARGWKALLSCYFTAHRFDELCQAYEVMPDEFRQDLGCRHLYLMASANLKESDVVRKLIEDTLNEADRDGLPEFFCKVHPIAETLGDAIGRATGERIATHASALAASQFDGVLKCAHYLRGKDREPESRLIENALRREAGDVRTTMKLDIFDAQLHFLAGRFDRQCEALNKVLAKQNLGAISLKNDGAPLACENLKPGWQPAASAEGPLVSIIMPAHNSAVTIGYALESLRNQSYRNLEVIVVEDGRDDETAGIVAQFCDVDRRFRLMSMERNSGTFVARNTALAIAAGAFVTNQDADDWAHPQKIATAVVELQRDPAIVATWVEHLRCSRERGFRALNGYFRPDASSLMFRREAVIDRIGWYDSVRAAGDGEFHLRMERAFGRGSIRRLDKLLSFVSWSEASLSGGGAFRIDDDLGLFSPARSEYRRSFGLWHETATRLYMPFPLDERPFPAPESLLP